MNRKALDTLVDEAIERTAVAFGINLTNRTGIDPRRQMINGKVYESLLSHLDSIIKGTNPPAVTPPLEAAPAPAAKPAARPKPAASTADAA